MNKLITMKKIITIALVLFTLNLSAQVALGKNFVSGNNILEFSDDMTGIVLPNTDEVNDPTAGTLTFNRNSKQVEYYDGTNWQKLSLGLGEYTSNGNEIYLDEGEGLTISDGTMPITNAKGVLVLESRRKGLNLPHVASPHLNIINPKAGTICYDPNTKSIAVFNGTDWSFLY